MASLSKFDLALNDMDAQIAEKEAELDSLRAMRARWAKAGDAKPKRTRKAKAAKATPVTEG